VEKKINITPLKWGRKGEGGKWGTVIISTLKKKFNITQKVNFTRESIALWLENGFNIEISSN